MGFLDTFKGNQYKSEVERLQAELNQLRSTFNPLSDHSKIPILIL